MIFGDITGLGGLDAIIDRVHRYQNINLQALVDRIATIVREDIRAAVASGNSPAGGSFAPLKESTRRRRDRDGDPPGGGADSSLVRDLVVQVEPDGDGFRIRVGWQGRGAQAAVYFDRGSKHQAARPIRGIGDETRQKIQRAVADFVRSLGGD